MNLSGATNPTSKVDIKGSGIGGEGLEDTVHVTAEVWLVWGDAGRRLSPPYASCTVTFPEDKAIDYIIFYLLVSLLLGQCYICTLNVPQSSWLRLDLG